MRELLAQMLTVIPMGLATILGIVFMAPLIAHMILEFEFKAPRATGVFMTLFVLFSLFCLTSTIYQGLDFVCRP